MLKIINAALLAISVSGVAFAQDIPARSGTVAVEQSGALKAPKKGVDKEDIAKN